MNRKKILLHHQQLNLTHEKLAVLNVIGSIPENCLLNMLVQQPKHRTTYVTQFRYRLNHLSTIYERFVIESSNNCHYSTFTQYVISFVVKPSINDWSVLIARFSEQIY